MSKELTIVVPFILPWERPADYQRQTCLELAKHHPVIAYMQGDAIFFLKALIYPQRFYLKHKNMRFYRPLYLLPFRRLFVVEKLNQQISYLFFQASLFFGKQCVLWIFDPLFYALPFVHRGKTLYDCVDYHRGFHKTLMRKSIAKMEEMLIRRVNYFFVNSHTLYNLHKSIRKPNRIVPQGFDLSSFNAPVDSQMRIVSEKRVIGFVGAIDKRLDFSLLTALISRNSQWKFVLYGPIQADNEHDAGRIFALMSKLKESPHVICGYSKDRREIPGVLAQFDVGIIPYRTRLDSVRYSFPMKLFEYFYAGKPIVSSPIEELKRFSPYVLTGNSVEQWEYHIHTLLSNRLPTSSVRIMRSLAVANNWENKIREILLHIKIA